MNNVTLESKEDTIGLYEKLKKFNHINCDSAMLKFSKRNS